MARAVICPVCLGKGTVKKKVGMSGWTPKYKEVTCHGCGGKGWVEVSD